MANGSKILVANLGSTSFKYRLFDMSTERQMARGGAERIGATESQCFVEMDTQRQELVADLPDHAAAVRQCVQQMTHPEKGCLKSIGEVAGIGFKAVHGGRVSGVQRINEDVLEAMEEMSSVAPAHNPPYIAAMRLLAEKVPEIPMVAAFETGFHETIPDRMTTYAIPYAWTEQLNIRKWGFHGASHRYIAQRTTELLGTTDLRIISCHLGGSSSLCAIRNGKSVATSMGMSPQSGVPQNNRVGDFDPYALPSIIRHTGQSLDDVLATMANSGGLLGISRQSGDIRELERAAENGDQYARLALDVYVSEIRRHLGGLLLELGGADALVFTGGIGENGTSIRASICAGLESLGIAIAIEANAKARGECDISGSESRSRIWTIPTNEELIVARQTHELLSSR